MKKRRFNLFSFSIESELLLYYSKDGVKNFLVFSILKTNNLEKLIPILNSLLRKGMT